MSELTRFATRAVEIDGIEFNNGDIIPMNIYIEDDSDFVRYEGGKNPSQKDKRDATKTARKELQDTGLSSASFEGSEKISTEPVKELFKDGDTKEETEEVETEEKQPEVVVEDTKTEEAPKKDEKKK